MRRQKGIALHNQNSLPDFLKSIIRGMVIRMKKYILKNKGLALAYLIVSLVVSGMTVYLSIILRDIVDTALSFDLDGFYHLLITSAIFFILFGIFYYISEVLYAGFIAKAFRSFREDVFDGIMRQEVAQFESSNSADYISALTNDIKLLEDNYFLPLATAAQEVLVIIIAIGFMIYFSFIVAGGLLGTLIFLIVIPALFGGAIKKRQTKLSKHLSLFTIRIKDIFSGFEVIKSYQMDINIKKNFQESNNDVVKSNFSLYHFSSIVGAISSVIGLFLQVGVVFFSAYLIIQGRLTAGSLVGLLIVASQITGPVQSLGGMIPMITGSKEIIERLEGFATQASGHKGNQIAMFNNEIKIKNLEFTYPDGEESAIKRLDFTFERNKKYALVGASGCGKTTLAKLLIGYLNDYEGNILYDQVELKKLTPESLGQISSMVHQQVYMFDETIEANITLHQTYQEEELATAIQSSGVSLFLNDERTLQSTTGENGAHLSGGQRQRIAVARALIRNKPLLILDEGTAALDRQTATDIEQRLLAFEDLTLITITHFLDAELLSQYDEIIYMEDGRIVESGSYAALLESQGKLSQSMKG